MESNNPKDKIGATKVCVSVVPEAVLMEAAVALMEGAKKYGRYNFRNTECAASAYYDASRRHLAAFWEGRDIDPESGLPEITKAIASLIILRDLQRTGRIVDDRPPKSDLNWLEELNKLAAPFAGGMQHDPYKTKPPEVSPGGNWGEHFNKVAAKPVGEYERVRQEVMEAEAKRLAEVEKKVKPPVTAEPICPDPHACDCCQ